MPAAKGQKGRKIGRNKAKCESYRKSDRREKNAVLRRARAVRRQERLVLYGIRKAARYLGPSPSTSVSTRKQSNAV